MTTASRQVHRDDLPWRKKFFFALVIFVGLPVAALAALELGGRAYVHFRYGRPGKSYGIYMADPVLGATHRPNSYNSNSVINNWGFRNVEDVGEIKPPGSTRVYCSGGSTTYCYNLTTEQAWPSRLEADLRRQAGRERDEVLNAGQICFPVASELTLARRVVPRLKPDVVVVFTAVNEMLGAGIIAGEDHKNLDDLLRRQEWEVVPFHLDQARLLKRESVLARFIDYKVKTLLESRLTKDYRGEGARPQPPHPWIMANFEHSLSAYLDFLKGAGVLRVVMVRWGDSGSGGWYVDEMRRFRDRGVEIGRARGAEVFDFSQVAEKHPRRQALYIETGVHLSVEGADLFAARLAEFIAARR